MCNKVINMSTTYKRELTNITYLQWRSRPALEQPDVGSSVGVACCSRQTLDEDINLRFADLGVLQIPG